MLGVMCLVALLQLVLSVLVFFTYRLCDLMCAVCFYWLIGDALLMHSGVVSLW